ncbi:MAG: hypothetical protein AVDCRST_MAG18-3489, partial [uncultured Thermomicrobiales bacterium]
WACRLVRPARRPSATRLLPARRGTGGRFNPHPARRPGATTCWRGTRRN